MHLRTALSQNIYIYVLRRTFFCFLYLVKSCSNQKDYEKLAKNKKDYEKLL